MPGRTIRTAVLANKGPEEIRVAGTLLAMFREFATFGDGPAVIAFVGERRADISFAELTRRAHRFAETVARCRFGPGTTVGLMGPNSPEWIEAFWGIVASGLVVMPIDPQVGDDDLRRMLRIGECRVIFAATSLIGRINAINPDSVALDLTATAPAESEKATGLTNLGQPCVAPSDVAIVVFTSGTTGPPKAVPLTHANLLSNVRALTAEGLVGRDDRILLPLALHHTYPLTVGMLTVLGSGACLILPARIAGPELVEAIQAGHATILLGVPRLYTALVENISAAIVHRSSLRKDLFSASLSLSRRAQRLLHLPIGRWLFRPIRRKIGPELRLMVCGGAALSPGIEAALEGLGWVVLTGYGLTETSPIVTFNRAGRSCFGSAGQPLPGVSIRIAKADTHGVGEIEAWGSSVFAGYRRDPDAPRAAFTADGWFRTGDLGRLDAKGNLFVVARQNETIVLSSGLKIFPEPVEDAYSEDPLIQEIAVFGHEGKLVALIVPSEEEVRKAGAIRLDGLVRDALEMRARTLPSYLRLAGFAVTWTPLPRTRLGKIQRNFLPSLYEHANVPRQASESVSIAPHDVALLENQRGKMVWRWLRDRYPNQPIELDTSPQLDLGIDSLGWIDLTLALQRDLEIRLTEAQIAGILTLGDFVREAIAAAKGAQDGSTIESLSRQQMWLEPYGPGVAALRLVGEALLRAVMRSVFRLRVEGRENLPDPPFILCPNHVSYLDPFALAAALPHRHLRRTYWAGWTGILFSSRLRRLFSRAAQVIPVDPDRAAASAIALGGSVISLGRTLVWFPEGGLSPDGTLQQFLPGIGAVLEAHPVAVVPVYLFGGDKALPLGKHFPRPSAITVRFGSPVQPARLCGSPPGHIDHQAIANVIHDGVAVLRDLGSKHTNERAL